MALIRPPFYFYDSSFQINRPLISGSLYICLSCEFFFRFEGVFGCLVNLSNNRFVQKCLISFNGEGFCFLGFPGVNLNKYSVAFHFINIDYISLIEIAFHYVGIKRIAGFVAEPDCVFITFLVVHV